MRSTAWLMLYSTANSALGYPLQQNQDSVHAQPRDLLGLLGDDDGTATPSPTQIIYSTSSSTSNVAPKSSLDVEQPTTAYSSHQGKTMVRSFTTTVHPTQALQAMISTGAKEITRTDVVYSTQPLFVPEPSARSAATITTAGGGYIAQAPGDTPPAELTEWKVIGVAVISVTLIAIIILSITFFDSWWGFLRAAITGRNKEGGNETLLADPEQRSWEFKLASEDGHRYPTMGSLESIAKEKDRQADRRVICDGQAPSNRQSNF